MKISKIERFLMFSAPEPNTGCWLWSGTGDKDGYGLFWINSKNIRAHRASYKLFIGEIPKGLWVLHNCDVPACVNPDHLFLGTAKDNAIDRNNKGRGFIGVGKNNGASKLSDVDVNKIRQLLSIGLFQSEIAKKFNVSQAQISNIKRGKRRSKCVLYDL